MWFAEDFAGMGGRGAQSGIPVQDLSSAPGLAVWRAGARPSVTRRCNPVSRSRASAAERLGAATGGAVGMVPGTRFAFGSRLGSPAVVGAPGVGVSTVFAARQPSSAGDDQRFPAVRGEPGVRRPPWNQCDSIASKIGSLRSSAGFPVGGTTTASTEPVSCCRPCLTACAPPACPPPACPPRPPRRPGPEEPAPAGASGGCGPPPPPHPPATGGPPSSTAYGLPPRHNRSLRSSYTDH